MTDDHMQYGNMVDDALRSVVLRALNQVAQTGLPGEHHFYLTFKTWYPGVQIPDHLRQRFDDEMTIVLQHQFWDMHVDETEIRVTLSFNGKPEPLIIPFPGLSGFFDPSVQFGLQFKVEGERPQDDADNDPGEPPVVALPGTDQTDHREADKTTAASNNGTDPIETTAQSDIVEVSNNKGEDSAAASSDNVVTLDTFRKK